MISAAGFTGRQAHKLLLLFGMLVAVLNSCETHEMDEEGLLVPRTVDEDPSLPSIYVNGTQLHAESFGNPNDPMLIALHGGPGGDYRYLLNCAEFVNDGFFVVMYDQRGSGLSKRYNANVYTVQLFIDDLDAVINHYKKDSTQKVFLLGQSWGAMLATAYVDQHPKAISGLILAEPGGFTWKDTKDYIERFRTLHFFNETSNDYVYVDQFITGDDHRVLDYKASLMAAADFADGNKTGVEGFDPYWRFGAVCNKAAMDYAEKHGFDFTTHLNQFNTKVLFVYSELNEAYGKTHAEKVSSAYPNVELEEIMGHGHEMTYFGWDKFYPLAKNYLNEVK